MKLFRGAKKKEQPIPRRRLSDSQSSDSSSSTTGPFVAGRSMAYRRNRTLTGSSSPHVASSNELDAELQSPRAHVHHLSNLRNKILRRLAIAVIAMLGLYGFMSQFTASVVLSDPSRYSGTQAAAYVATVEAYYGSHPVERLRPALNSRALLGYVQARHPEIASLALDHSAEIGKGVLSITSRQPVARWIIDNKTEFVDQNGVVFSYTPFEKPAIEIVDNNLSSAGATINLVASHRFLSFVGQVVGRAQEQGYTVRKVTIPLLTTRQLEVSLRGVKYPTKMTIDRSAGEQVEDMSRVINYLKRKSIGANYIDVRIPGKAFYR